MKKLLLLIALLFTFSISINAQEKLYPSISVMASNQITTLGSGNIVTDIPKAEQKTSSLYISISGKLPVSNWFSFDAFFNAPLNKEIDMKLQNWGSAGSFVYQEKQFLQTSFGFGFTFYFK